MQVTLLIQRQTNKKMSDIVETEVVADDDSNIPTFVASEDADKSDGDESGKDK